MTDKPARKPRIKDNGTGKTIHDIAWSILKIHEETAPDDFKDQFDYMYFYSRLLGYLQYWPNEARHEEETSKRLTNSQLFYALESEIKKNPDDVPDKLKKIIGYND